MLIVTPVLRLRLRRTVPSAVRLILRRVSIAEVSAVVTGTVALGTPLINGLVQARHAKRP